MKFNEKHIIWFLLGIGFFIAIAFTFAGCATTDIVDRSGAQLWGENCSRCHNIRPPQGLTDAQWELAGMHMRTRANLTAVETHKIVDFLKTAN